MVGDEIHQDRQRDRPVEAGAACRGVTRGKGAKSCGVRMFPRPEDGIAVDGPFADRRHRKLFRFLDASPLSRRQVRPLENLGKAMYR